MGPFEYFEPLTIQETSSLLRKHRGNAKILAAGTDLVNSMKEQTICPKCIVSIGRITDLDYISFSGEDGLRIGALTTIRNLEESQKLRPSYMMICEAASQLGSMPIRNVATLGGNLCNAAPSADMAPILIAMSAAVRLAGSTGDRLVLLEEFFTGPYNTVLQHDELLVEIQIPVLPANTGGAYLKLRLRGGEDLAVVGVAAVITLTSEDERCVDIKIVLGAVAPTPMRAREAERVLRGEKIDEALIERAGQAASYESRPITDVRGTSQYRKEMVRLLTKNAIREAVSRITVA